MQPYQSFSIDRDGPEPQEVLPLTVPKNLVLTLYNPTALDDEHYPYWIAHCHNLLCARYMTSDEAELSGTLKWRFKTTPAKKAQLNASADPRLSTLAHELLKVVYNQSYNKIVCMNEGESTPPYLTSDCDRLRHDAEQNGLEFFLFKEVYIPGNAPGDQHHVHV